MQRDESSAFREYLGKGLRHRKIYKGIKLKLKTIYTITLVAALAVITGCSANQSGQGYCNQKGRLSAYAYPPQNNVCKVDFRYHNLARNIQKPVIDIIAYDEKGQIIGQGKLRFQEVKSGASQNLPQVLQCDNQKIFRIYVSDAVDANRCYGYKCSDLCDIKNSTIQLSK